MIATRRVKLLAILLLGGATLMAILVLAKFGYWLFDAAAVKYKADVLAPGKII